MTIQTDLQEIEKGIKWIIRNWDYIPDKNKEDLRPSRYKKIEEIPIEEHFVILILDRQKPSVVKDYDFDEERIGITKTGRVIWGFDSGCSCPTPWDDNFPDCYQVSKSWKEFEVNLKTFDDNVIEECLQSINQLKADKQFLENAK